MLERDNYCEDNKDTRSGQEAGRVWNRSVRDKREQAERDGLSNTAKWRDSDVPRR